MSSKSPGLKRKQFVVKIFMLDDSEIPFQIDPKSTGSDLINVVYQHLKLIESDYFSLEFINSKGKKCWLDYDRPVSKQVQTNSRLLFSVKFYTPDPGQLEEEYTRYLYALQIKRDLGEGLLLCSDATASLLASYILQAEMGDYVDNFEYFANKKFFPHQNEEHHVKILDYYKNHIGQSPADADLNLLDIARKIELYGIVMHPAKDHEGVQLNLAVAHMGILVFQNYTKINTFSWAKIRKLSFKRKKFLVKLHPENFGFYKDTVEFYFDNRDDSKNFWKNCIEHHSFFRCVSTKRMPRPKTKLLARGSSFRYYGRTQKELIENARENFSKNRSFDRSYHSMRNISQFGASTERNTLNGTNGAQSNGTQSLNRNLASRSTGAILIPNGSSMMNSNESGLYNNLSSSTHQIYEKTAPIQKTLSEQQTGPNSVPALNNYRELDASTQGSRTIDSRYGKDRTLAMSEDDEDDEDEDDDDDEDEEGADEDQEEEDDDQQVENEQQHRQQHHHAIKDDHGDEQRCTCNHQDEDEEEPDVSSTNVNVKLAAIKNVLKPSVEDHSNSSSSSNNNTNTSSFRKGNHSKANNLISLPIQLQQSAQNKPNVPKRIEIKNGTTTIMTESETPSSNQRMNTFTQAPVNPNKIYSRKEVITTYKEETKNTHLEEYQQTTTFYDQTSPQSSLPMGTNASSSSTSSSYRQPKSPQTTMSNNGLVCTLPINSSKSSSQHQSPQQQVSLSMMTNMINQQPGALSAAKQPLKVSSTTTTTTTLTSQTLIDQAIKQFTENDYDDEATKHDRCSLAARIIYSNLPQYTSGSNASSSIKRPATLPKPVLSMSSGSYARKLEKDFDDEQFPPPPPQTENRNQAPVILQDYQEPNALRLTLEKQIYNVEDEFKRKKNVPNEESYFIVKELVMTERTYKKDLDLLTSTFRQFAVTNNFDLSELPLFDKLLYPQVLEPIHIFHTQFLKELELRLFYWTDKPNNSEEYHKIGDLLNRLNLIIKNYRTFIDKYDEILNELDLTCKRNKRFEALYQEFEAQKICYLPFTMFLLKPIQRLLHYKLLFERILIYYGVKHYDYQETYNIYTKIEDAYECINEKLPIVENKQKLLELQKDLIGVDNLLASSPKHIRCFLREGSLQKLSRKGYQQRMFFLFNDVLLYCARNSGTVLQFKVHGEYQLKNIQVEDGNAHINIPNSFTIYSSNRSLLVAAVSSEEKSKWLQDLYEAIEKAKGYDEDNKCNFSTFKSNSSSDNNLDSIGVRDLVEQADSSIDNHNHTLAWSASEHSNKHHLMNNQHRINTTMHVCWHRNTSVGSDDIHKSLVNQMSGYLLRKFKNSNGWQKLWVVFTNFCLFFYKTYQDEFPLASLPLLGYTVTQPTESDNINKDFVFKLQFKNHVYFFRAESHYAFDRWLEVIESAAQKKTLLLDAAD